jgi:hypothetical protein
MVDRHLDELRRRGLESVTENFRALGYTFSIRCQDAVLADYLDEVFKPFIATDTPEIRYEFGSIIDSGRKNYLLFSNGKMLDNHRRPSVPFSTLLWHINRGVVRSSQDRLLLHASGVAQGGIALLFPAAMESGKTTLAAGLLRRGFEYITDEIIAIRPDDAVVERFPRALSVDEGSWAVLADLHPQLPPELALYVGDQWQIPPLSVPGGMVADRLTVPRFVISPQYQAGGSTRLIGIGRAEAVSLMAKHSFNLSRHGQAGLAALAAVARSSRCYRLEVASLEVACDLISSLVEEAVPD